MVESWQFEMDALLIVSMELRTYRRRRQIVTEVKLRRIICTQIESEKTLKKQNEATVGVKKPAYQAFTIRINTLVEPVSTSWRRL